MLKLKVCGMRKTNNIEQLLTLQPDYMGFIFHPSSPRFVNRPISIPKPKHTKYVGVFVNETLEGIIEKINTYQLDMIQLHGQESPEFCNSLSKYDIEIIKAFNIDANTNFSTIESYSSSCAYFLFDAKGKLPGGNGHSFNWELLKRYKGNTPFFLSGGITLSMAWKIKYLNHPKLYAIDINSKFEYEPALKNIHQINMFKDELQG